MAPACTDDLRSGELALSILPVLQQLLPPTDINRDPPGSTPALEGTRVYTSPLFLRTLQQLKKSVSCHPSRVLAKHTRFP